MDEKAFASQMYQNDSADQEHTSNRSVTDSASLSSHKCTTESTPQATNICRESISGVSRPRADGLPSHARDFNCALCWVVIVLFAIVVTASFFLPHRMKGWFHLLASANCNAPRIQPLPACDLQRIRDDIEKLQSRLSAHGITDESCEAQVVTPLGFTAATTTSFAYSVEEADAKVDGEQAIVVIIQCPGVCKAQGCLIPNGIEITIHRPAQFGQPPLQWIKRFQFDGGMEYKEDESSLEHGVLSLFFRAPRRIVSFAIDSLQQHASTIGASSRQAESSCAPSSSGVSSFQMVSMPNLGLASDQGSDLSSIADTVKCYLPNTAFQGLDGNLILVQNLQEGSRVRLSDGREATVSSTKLFPWKRKKMYRLRVLGTSRGAFELSAGHRVPVPGGEQRAEHLKVGDRLFVGTREQQLLTVTEKEARTDLYAVSFIPDGMVEAFQIPNWGLQTLGEPPCPSVREAQTQDLGQYSGAGPHELLTLLGVAHVTEEDLEIAMPTEYED